MAVLFFFFFFCLISMIRHEIFLKTHFLRLFRLMFETDIGRTNTVGKLDSLDNV